MNVTDSIINVGASSYSLDLFEGQYAVPNGMAYNSYLILDEKTALIDGTDKLVQTDWLANISQALSNRQLDYFIMTHLEPDHSAGISELLKTYPDVKIVANSKMLTLMQQFYDIDVSSVAILVKDNESLTLGKHILNFIFAPMVHWPEVMMIYEQTEKVLFSADAFGKFGAIDCEEDWACEARRYYFNIVGKYGVQVQNVLKKIADKPIEYICSLHGPVLMDKPDYYLNLYNIWSSYLPEKDGVFIAYASIYGNTEKAALLLKERLESKGIAVTASDLARSDMSENVEDAFKYGKLVIASPTLDGDIFPAAKEFVEHLLSKNFQNRTVGIIENGSWAPQAAKLIKAKLESAKNITLLENIVTVRSGVSVKNLSELDEMANDLA